MDRLTATYRLESPGSIDEAAAILAGEQSSGTFVPVPGESDALRERFAARVEAISDRQRVSAPSLPGAAPSKRGYEQATVVVSWPTENFGYNLPALVSTLQGNLYELRQLSGVKLLDVEFPDSFAEHFRGPAFGVEGTRRLANVWGRPLIGTIIKPSVGMPPADTAELVRTLVEAGVDFIKDDELMADPPHAPLRERVDQVMRVVNEHADRTGKKVLVAFNISDEMDRMLDHYDYIVQAEGACVMVSINSVGLAGVRRICDLGALPVHGHRNGWGMLTRHPLLGIEFAAYQKMWRLAGVDHLHVNGIGNKFWEPDDSVVRSIRACQTPMWGGYEALPVVSSGQWGGQAPETYRRTETVDLLYLAGGGILAHPDGPAAGVEAIRQAWQAALEGRTLEEAAATSPELRQSIRRFGHPPGVDPAPPQRSLEAL